MMGMGMNKCCMHIIGASGGVRIIPADGLVLERTRVLQMQNRWYTLRDSGGINPVRIRQSPLDVSERGDIPAATLNWYVDCTP